MQILQMPGFVRSKICDDIQLRVAATREERQRSFELIYRSYLRTGLCSRQGCGMRVTPYQLLTSTDIILAELRGQVISTVSLVRDGELGLPMEAVFPDEVAARRAAGIGLAEVSCLADRRQGTARFFGLFCELSRLMAQLARKTSVDELVVVVNPRHAPLYRRYMAFEQIGEERVYDAVQGFPAVPLSLNFAKAKTNKPKSWHEFFGQQLPDDVLQSCPISEEDRDYFSSVLDQAADGEDTDVCYGNSETVEAEDRLLCA
jgi:N-acyl amino acid synthase FeeM